MPTRINNQSPGYSLHAIDGGMIPAYSKRQIRTGLEIVIPKGYYARILNPSVANSITFNRISNQTLKGLEVINAIIDHYYEKELVVLVNNFSTKSYFVNSSDVVAQIIFQKIEEVNVEILPGIHKPHLGNSKHICRYTVK